MKNVLEEEKDLHKTLKTEFNKEMIISKQEETIFKNAEVCHICNKYTKEDTPVRDHCHVTRKYRGSAHNTCNRSFRLTYKIFHNLSGYDAHLIL